MNDEVAACKQLIEWCETVEQLEQLGLRIAADEVLTADEKAQLRPWYVHRLGELRRGGAGADQAERGGA